MPKRASFLFALTLLLSRAAFAQSPNNARMLSTPNAVTSASYTFAAADTTRVVTFSNASAVAVTLPNGATVGFGAGTLFSVANLGAGAVTITCSSCTINGAATLVLSQNQGADIYGGAGSPAVNYVALPSPSGTFSNITATSLAVSGQITSTVATGTAPFSIASTSVVPNLNAQLHNGLTAPGSAIVGVSDTQTLTNKSIGAGAVITSSGSGGTMASQGVDINSSNQVTQLHFGATAVPTEATATTGKMLNVDGAGNIAATSLPVTASTCTMSSGTCNVNAGALSSGSYHSCFASWNGTGTLTGVVKAVKSGANNTCTVTSSVNTDTATMNVYWVWSALP